MQNLTPAITSATTELLDTVLALALPRRGGGDTAISGMRADAETAVALAQRLHELLEIQTQGGGGPADEGWNPADPATVIREVRAHTLAKIAEMATVTTPDGALHLYAA